MTMNSFDYDLFVIGAGSGGVRGARVAASMGARVAIAEEYRVGGTCVIRGCVPKKLLVYASKFSGMITDAEGFGWSIPKPAFSWQTLINNKDREIDRLNAIYLRNLERSNVEIFQSRAVLEDRHTIKLLGEGHTITAKNILIATGAKPFIPEIVGAEHVITSNEALHLEELPDSIAIIGGGYIALEFATIFAGLGVNVSVIYRGPQILRGFDDDIRDALAEELTKRGVDIRCNTDVVSVTPDRAGDDRGGYVLDFKDGDSLHKQKVMYATGRVPNTTDLGLEKAGIDLGWNGYVIVDEYSRSSVENIYAVGDVTHRVNLTPVAISEAMAFCETVFNNNPTPVDHEFIATAVFTEPEIGTIGLSEAEAREKCRTVDIYKSRFRPMFHTLSGRDEQTLMKLVVDGDSDRVVGCHILGPDAAEMVQIAAISMRMGATKADFDATMALHPCAAEELVTMQEKWHPPADGM
jgi:glutathione reductase (NADPH)